MVDFVNEINYDRLVEKSLRNVVYYALKIVEEQGLPGENHFYITFKTNFSGTVVSKNLKIQYPDTMTIVLQNQFDNLVVRHNSFSVDLSFGGISQTITIPYDAITYFADPYAKFGLSFEQEVFEDAESPLTQSVASGNAEVVSIDSYRKK
ncbi:MAG: stringent starvation protein B [Alphaproteobacteria bacterium]|nr:stringent starvation protein B [Alphaproteobacteria bacterium]